MGVTVAIHQPNFLPWLGFFDKWMKADVFVLLDDAQIPKSGGSWVNRCRILSAGKATWMTVPINRSYSGFRAITDIECHCSDEQLDRIITRISRSYASAPFFDEVFPLVRSSLDGAHRYLLNLNLEVLRGLAGQLALPMEKIILASSLEVDSSSTERLCDITQALGGDTYLSGLGAAQYQEEALFDRRGITLAYQNFVETPYEQIGVTEFVPGLSILDVLMTTGFDQLAKTISSWSPT